MCDISDAEQPHYLVGDCGAVLGNDCQKGVILAPANDEDVACGRNVGNSRFGEVKTPFSPSGVTPARVIPSEKSIFDDGFVVGICQVDESGGESLFCRRDAQNTSELVHTVEL